VYDESLARSSKSCASSRPEGRKRRRSREGGVVIYCNTDLAPSGGMIPWESIAIQRLSIVFKVNLQLFNIRLGFIGAG
jgi:hypothetical protein